MLNKNRNSEAENLPDFDPRIWNAAGDYIYEAEATNNQAWNRFEQGVKPVRQFTVFRSRYLQVAASIILIAIISATAWYIAAVKTNKNFETILAQTSFGEMKEVTLADGSVVKLNANSKLIISEDFGLKNREVKLQGQAFFEVKRNEKLPFRVAGEKINIQVLGTAFDVCSYPGEESFVAVSHGKVQVNANGTEKILTQGMAVKTGQGALLNDNAGSVVWSTGELQFTKASLLQVSDAVFHRTGKKLLFDKTHSGRTFTGSFDSAATAEKMAETLSVALSLEIQVSPK